MKNCLAIACWQKMNDEEILDLAYVLNMADRTLPLLAKDRTMLTEYLYISKYGFDHLEIDEILDPTNVK